MKRHTQQILYYLLPVVFWLLAIGGSILPLILPIPTSFPVTNYAYGYLVAVLVWICIALYANIKRHESAVTPSFHVALLLSIASYWLPTVIFLLPCFWIYLMYRSLWNMRVFLASLIGVALVAIWAACAIYMGWILNPWAEFFASKNAWGWIPSGALLLAWLTSTIVRQNLRVR